jgi:dTDP-4-dehydrorhamnose 3,5-epimerase
MEIIQTGIEGLFVIKPQIFEDIRGYFFESYSKEMLSGLGACYDFVQDNQSFSHIGVLRGLHFQNPPFEQCKLVRVIQGSVQDVAVDIRKNSPTYGKYHSVILSGDNKLMYLVPPGFAHGFLALEDNTIFAYKCSRTYNKVSEGAIRWNDPDLGIEWMIKEPLLSDKDLAAGLFKGFVSKFLFPGKVSF